jgi:hypothetical protein
VEAELAPGRLLFRFIAAAYERRDLGISSRWPFESWGRFCPSTPPPSACSTPAPRSRRRASSGPTGSPPPFGARTNDKAELMIAVTVRDIQASA